MKFSTFFYTTGLSLCLFSFSFATHTNLIEKINKRNSKTESISQNKNKDENESKNETIAKNLIINADNIYDPDHLSLLSLTEYNETFTLNYNDYASVLSNKSKIEEIETFLKETPPNKFNELSTTDKESLAAILFKLGTYYTHVIHRPDPAIAKLNQAEPFYTNQLFMAWNHAQLAYAYEQKFALNKKEEDKKKALTYTNQVLSLYAVHNNHEAAALAYCVQGLIENQNKHYFEAEFEFQRALKVYEKAARLNDAINNAIEVPVIRAKNKLACIMLESGKQNEAALTSLQKVKKYWSSRKETNQNPYAARNFLSLGYAYLKLGKTKDAKEAFEKVIQIYSKAYGSDTKLLAKPYLFLSQTYKILGKPKLTETYQAKADKLSKIES